MRRRQLAGFKFRRQHQVGLYICDFASLDASLIVELEQLTGDGIIGTEMLMEEQLVQAKKRAAG